MAIEGVSGTGLEAQSSQTDAVKSLIRWESPHPLSIAGVVVALAGTGMKGERRRERYVPAEKWCNEAIRMIIASGSGTGFGRWRAARHTAALEDLDNDHIAAAART